MAEFPHDPRAFTQGLVFQAGRLFESTGQRGYSELREVELGTGRVLRKRKLENRYFAEGLAAIGDRLFQLTWQSGVCFVYSRDDFEPLYQLRYPGEGWGLCHNGSQLILSSGSSLLRFFEPETFTELRRVAVKLEGRPVDQLNELEYVGGEVWANRWHDDRIYRIRPEDGAVVGVIDLTGLNTFPRLNAADGTAQNVLNGIAFDPETGRIWVTGKLWPKLFEIELVER